MVPSSPKQICCTYCGLPVGSGGSIESVPEVPVYCCSGCRFAHAVTSDCGEEGHARWTLTKLAVAMFFSMNVLVITLAMWAYDIDPTGTADTVAQGFFGLFRYVCLLLAYPVLFLLAGPLVLNAGDEIRRGRFSADLLILLGVISAYTISTIAVWRGTGSIYFEVGCMTLVFVTLGRWLEATGKLRSSQSLDELEQLIPATVTAIDSLGMESVRKTSEISIGDVVVVREGERIPVDGRIVHGQTSVDEQLVSGESWPVERTVGQSVIGGTLVLDGRIAVRVDVPTEESTLQRLVEAVRQARNHRSRYQLLADRISQVFVPATLCIAVLTFIVHAAAYGVVAGILTGLSVVLIACPCALGLATPMALWAAVGTAARRGIVFRSLDALQQLANVTIMFFDKTGTLTTGQPKVRCLMSDEQTDLDEIRYRARHLCRASSHLFSRALAEYLGPPLRPLDVQTSAVPGKGVYGIINGEFQPTAIGNLRMMSDLDIEIPPIIQAEIEHAGELGAPFVLVGWGGSVRGLFELEEELRPAVVNVFAELQRRQLSLTIVTGDHLRSAQRVGTALGIAVHAETSPEGKQKIIKQAHASGEVVALIGDGVNDAPALAVADVGIALGCGADVSRDSAAICLVSNDLTQLPWLIEHARRTNSVIRSNLAWAFGYNSLGIIVAASGWLHPAIAAILMVGSSLFVISNSLKLTSDDQDSLARDSHQLATVPDRESHPPVGAIDKTSEKVT